MKSALLISLAVLILVINIFGIYYVNHKVNKIVVVDVIKVLDEFKLKKDLEAKVEVALSDYSNRVDSLTAMVNYVQKNNPAKLPEYSKDLTDLKEEAQKMYAYSNKSINEQVWKRLNPIIEEYGKSGGYRVIIGANGMGTVLYEDGVIDNTQELIKYANKKYESGN